jgi:hypothetical protein
MNDFDREIALYKIQNIIAEKIKNNTERNYEIFKKKIKPLLEERNKILLGDEVLIKKYLEMRED